MEKKDKILEKEKKVKRHGFAVPFAHWLVAVSTFLLIFSGLGQIPLYRRYMVDTLPGLGWTSDFEITLIIHYIAAVVLIFAVVFHLVFHALRREFDIFPKKGDVKESIIIIKAMFTGEKEPPSDKYLAEQRLAYVFIGFVLLLAIFTGIFKALQNLPGLAFSPVFLSVMTHLHNLATVLIIVGIVVHLAAFAFKSNRPLVPAIFTGKLDLKYVKNRHKIWYEKMLDSFNKTK